MKPLGTLEEIKDLRMVWPHEALDFTPRLQNSFAISSACILELQKSKARLE